MEFELALNRVTFENGIKLKIPWKPHNHRSCLTTVKSTRSASVIQLFFIKKILEHLIRKIKTKLRIWKKQEAYMGTGVPEVRYWEDRQYSSLWNRFRQISTRSFRRRKAGLTAPVKRTILFHRRVTERVKRDRNEWVCRVRTYDSDVCLILPSSTSVCLLLFPSGTEFTVCSVQSEGNTVF